LWRLPVLIEQVEVDLGPSFEAQGRGHMHGIPEEGKLTIHGWVIGNGAIPVGVELSDQSDRKIADVPIDQRRPDVADAFPEAIGASTPGFKAILRPHGSGVGRIHARVAFDDGSVSEMAVLSCEISGAEGEGDPSWSVVSEDRENEKVMVGQGGWLYLRRDRNDILAQHTGKLRFESRQLSEWRRTLEGRVRESERRAAVWTCLVAPDKESVYPEHLPAKIVPVERRPIHEFLDVAAEVEAPVLYPLERLRAAKREVDVYPKVDTHWNYRGAYIAYRALCDDLLSRGVDLDVLEDGDVEWIERETEGDLGSKIRPEPIVGTTFGPRLRSPRGRQVADNEIVNHGWVLSFERAQPGPRCVVFGESFTHFLLPFLKESFQRMVYVHTSMFVPEILDRERPDAIVSLPTERFLIQVPDDANAMAELRATALRKGGTLPWPDLN
jgi:alginate O-acetyltransferase complex protein AlgJ